MAKQCIDEYDIKINSAERRVDKARNLMMSYITVQHKERERRYEEEKALSEASDRLRVLASGNSNSEDENSDVLIDILSLVDDALNPEPFKFDLPDFDKPIVPEFSIPEQYLPKLDEEFWNVNPQQQYFKIA